MRLPRKHYLIRKGCDRERVVSTRNRSIKEQLCRKGFDLVGEVYDNVKEPRLYTLHGFECLISDRERDGITIIGQARFGRKDVKPEFHRDTIYM